MKARLELLLVEDDASHARLIERTLWSAVATDIALKHVTSLAAALEALDVGEFDAILFDLGLPDAQGVDALTRLLHHTKNVPVVVLTADDETTTAVDAVAHGAQDFLYKGDMSGRTLERVLRHAVQRQEWVRQLREANRRLDRQNKMMARLCDTAQHFVDHVSHEFRAPLTVIKEYATVMSEGLLGEVSPKQRDCLNVIGERVDDLAVMVDDMLDASKFEAGLLSVWRRRCALGDVVARVWPIVERKAAARNVPLIAQLDQPLPEVFCDSEKLGRVLVNLILNAIKFSGEGDPVEVWAHSAKNGHSVVVGVTDHGPGIAEKERNVIFNRFHQVVCREAPTGRGFGLGLTIAKELAGLNLGKIHLKSSLGTGSTFSLDVPLAERAPLVEHFVRWLAHSPERVAWAALATAELSTPVDPDRFVLLDELLQHSFRAGDLVVPLAGCKWLVLLACPPQDVDMALRRVRTVWAEADRGQLNSALPPIKFSIHGVWQVKSQVDRIIERCLEEIEHAGNVASMQGTNSHDEAKTHTHCR